MLRYVGAEITDTSFSICLSPTGASFACSECGRTLENDNFDDCFVQDFEGGKLIGTWCLAPFGCSAKMGTT